MHYGGLGVSPKVRVDLPELYKYDCATRKRDRSKLRTYSSAAYWWVEWSSMPTWYTLRMTGMTCWTGMRWRRVWRRCSVMWSGAALKWCWWLRSAVVFRVETFLFMCSFYLLCVVCRCSFSLLVRVWITRWSYTCDGVIVINMTKSQKSVER